MRNWNQVVVVTFAGITPLTSARRLRRIAVRDTGDGRDPLALFVGTGARMLTASGWYRVRWAAWNRMKAHADEAPAELVPRRCWVFHDLRHTFALRLLIYLTEVALDEHHRRRVPMSTLLDHMSGNRCCRCNGASVTPARPRLSTASWTWLWHQVGESNSTPGGRACPM